MASHYLSYYFESHRTIVVAPKIWCYLQGHPTASQSQEIRRIGNGHIIKNGGWRWREEREGESATTD